MLIWKTSLFNIPGKRQQYNNNKIKIITLMKNYEFEWPDSSYLVLDIQGYNEYIIKKHWILPNYLPIHIYMNRINNRLVFKIKGGCKVQLQAQKS